MALCDNEDLNFEQIEYHRQVEMIKSLEILTFQRGEVICHDEDTDAVPFFIIIASEKTAKIAEVCLAHIFQPSFVLINGSLMLGRSNSQI